MNTAKSLRLVTTVVVGLLILLVGLATLAWLAPEAKAEVYPSYANALAPHSFTSSIVLAKFVTPADTIALDQVLTYTLILTNLGSISASNIYLSDPLPLGTDWTGLLQTSTGSASVKSRVLTWQGTLPVNSTHYITYSIRVTYNLPVGTLISNTAIITDQTGPLAEATAPIVMVSPTSIVNADQFASHFYARPGQLLTYTINIINHGNLPLSSVIVTNTLAPSVTLAAVSDGGMAEDGRVIWNGLMLPVGVSRNLTVVVTITSPLSDATVIDNRVSLAGDGQAPFELPYKATTTIYNPVEADFTATPTLGPVPLVTTLTNNSRHATFYSWSYGDGQTSTSKATTHTHTYSNAGVYTVTLRATNPLGSATVTRTYYITVYRPAVASFNASPTTSVWPQVVTFTNTSQYANQFLWYYGDGLTSTITATTHSHLYTAPGTYTVALVAIGSYNSHTYTRTAYINMYNQPVAGFTATPQLGVAPVTVWFSNTSQFATNYTWQFGDGASSTAVNASHTYTRSGIYTITLTARNPAIATTLTRSNYITIYNPNLLPDLSTSQMQANLERVRQGDVLTYNVFLTNSQVAATATLTGFIPLYTSYLPGSGSASDGTTVTWDGSSLHWTGQVISGTPVIIKYAVEVLTAPVGIAITGTADLDDGWGRVYHLQAVPLSIYDPFFQLTIDQAALYTNIPTVTLSLSWGATEPPITTMQISNDGGFSNPVQLPVIPEAEWVLSTYGSLQLPRIVYIRFLNEKGKQFGPFQDDIIYDPVAPELDLELVEPSNDTQAVQASSLVVRVTSNDDNSGISTVTFSDRPDFISPATITYPVNSPTQEWLWPHPGTVYAKVTDRAGNVSEVKHVSPPTDINLYLPLIIKNSE